MKLKRLKLQNVFAFGNQTQTIDFTDTRSLNLLVGKNGAGKTSIINCLKLSLYFDQVPLNVSDVSNQINGNGYLAVDFFSRGHDWTLESFYTKTSLKEIRVTRDGVRLDTGKIPETKAYIRQQVIDLPYSLFANIVSLSMNDFRSFLSMTPKDTRAIRDRVFGFHVLNDCREANKEAQKNYEKELQKAETEREFIERGLQHEIDELERQKTAEGDVLKRQLELEEKRKQLEEKLENIKTATIRANAEKAKGEALERVFVAIERRQCLTEVLHDIAEIETAIGDLQQTCDDKTERVAVLQRLKDIAYKQEKVKRRNALAQKIKESYTKMESLREQKETATDEISILDETLETNTEIERRNGLVMAARLSYDVYVTTEKTKAETEMALNTIAGQIQTLESKRAELQTRQQDIATRLQEHKKRGDLLRLGQCPTCAHDFHSPTYEQDLIDLDVVIAQGEQDLKMVTEALTKTVAEIKTRQAEQQSLRVKQQTIEKSGQQDFTEFNVTFRTSLPDVLPDFDSLVKTPLSYDKERHTALTQELQDITQQLATLETLTDSYLQEFHSMGDCEDEQEETQEEISLEKTNAEISEIQSETITLQRRVDSLRSTQVELQAKRLAYETELKQLPEVTETPTVSREELHQTLRQTDEDIKQLESLRLKFTEDMQSIILECMSNQKIQEDIKVRIQERITNFQQTLTEKQGAIARQTAVMSYLDIVDYVLSDTGLKSFIIRRQTPMMNAELSEILQSFDLNLVVRFDDEFHPVIYRFGQEVSAKTISLGQSKMIDFAIIVVIIRFLKNRCGDLNVIFLDEVFSSLHTTVLPTILETARRELVERLELNVFLVNHSPLSNALFDKKLEVSAVGNFSQITTEKTKEE